MGSLIWLGLGFIGAALIVYSEIYGYNDCDLTLGGLLLALLSILLGPITLLVSIIIFAIHGPEFVLWSKR